MSNKIIKELYHTRLYVCNSVKKAKKVHSRYSEEEFDLPENEFNGLTYYIETGVIIVVLDKNFKKLDIEDKLKIIAHESYHVLKYIHEFIGEYSEAEEMNAYLIGHINKYIIQELKLF